MNGSQISYEELLEKLNRLEVLLDDRNEEIRELKRELNLTKESAKESDEIFSLFLQNCPIYFFFKDENIRVLKVSSNFSELVGVEAESMVGKSMYDLFPADLAESMIKDDLKIIENNQTVEVEEELNGRYFYTLKFPIKRKGKPTCLAGFTMDITDRKIAENSLRENSRVMEELNAMKDKLFTIISHDLKNSFNTILGFSELLRANINEHDTERIQEMAGHIHTASRNTYDLLSNLLDWAKNHLKQFKVTKIELDAVLLIHHVIEDMKTLAGKKVVTISCKTNDAIRVYADINMLSTILRNLISNGIKYCHLGGTIDISVNDCFNEWEFRIQDNGVGMSEEERESIFTSKIQDSKEGTSNEKGSGLGLLICKEFVEKQGGEIRVESTIGQGSAFVFTLPKKD